MREVEQNVCVLERIIRTGGKYVNRHFSLYHRHGDEVVCGSIVLKDKDR